MFDKWCEKLRGLFGSQVHTAKKAPENAQKEILVQDLFAVIRPMVTIANAAPQHYVDAFEALLSWMDGGIDNPSSPEVLAFKIPLREVGFFLDQKVISTNGNISADTTITVPLATLQDLNEHLYILDDSGQNLQKKGADTAQEQTSFESNNVQFISQQAKQSHENLKSIFEFPTPDGENLSSMGEKIEAVFKNFVILLNKYEITNRPKPTAEDSYNSIEPKGFITRNDDFTL